MPVVKLSELKRVSINELQRVSDQPEDGLPNLPKPRVPGLDDDSFTPRGDFLDPVRKYVGETTDKFAKGMSAATDSGKSFDEQIGGATDVAESYMKAVTPAIAPTALRQLAGTGMKGAAIAVGEMALSPVAEEAGRRFAKTANAGPGVQKATGFVAGALPAGDALRRVSQPFRRQAARQVAEQAAPVGPALSKAEKAVMERVRGMEDAAPAPTPAPKSNAAAVPAAKAKAKKPKQEKAVKPIDPENVKPEIAMERMAQNNARMRAIEEQLAKAKAPEATVVKAEELHPVVDKDAADVNTPAENAKLLETEEPKVSQDKLPQISATVTDTIRAAEPGPEIPVSMRQLRVASPLKGADFDREILAAADRGDIVITTHDHGGALTPEQRAEAGLVQDDRDPSKWYTAATRLEDPPPPPAAAVEPVTPPAPKRVAADTPAPDLDAIRAKKGMPFRPVSPKRAKSQRGSFSFKPVRDEQLVRYEAEDPEFAARFKTVAERLNLGRMNMSEPELKNFVNSVYDGLAKGDLPARTVEAQSEIVKKAAELHPDLVSQVAAGEPIQDGITGRAVNHAIRERIQALNTMQTDAIAKLDIESKKLDADPEVVAQLEREADTSFNDLKEYVSRSLGLQSDAGRNLAAYKLLANKSTDLTFWTNQARKAMGLPPGTMIPDAKLKEIQSRIAEVQAADGARVDEAKMRLAKTVAQMRETGLIETVSILRNAGLLTGPRTHITNAISNVAFAAAEEVKRVPAAMADAAMAGLFGRDRTVQGVDAGAVARAIHAAGTKGVQEAKRVLREGAHAEHLDQGLRELNYQGLHRLADRTSNESVATGLRKVGDAVNFYGKAPFRALSASDRIFKAYHQQRALESGAWVQARQDAAAGLISRDQIKQRATEIVANPPKWMDLEAKAYAEFATFNNPNLLAKGIGAAERAVVDGLRAEGNDTAAELVRLAARTVVPFRNTPSNIITRILWDYSGLKASKELTQAAVSQFVKKTVTPQQQKAIAESVGRGAVGVGLAMLGYAMAQKGEATPVYNNDRGEQGVDEYAGRSQGSIKIGGMWHRIINVSPVGNMIGIGATMHHEANKSDATFGDRSAAVAGVATRTVAELPMMQGTKEVVDFMQDPGKSAGSFTSSMAGSFVPTIAADAATLQDPTRREYKPGKQDNAIAYGIKYRMPFMRSTLPEARDVLGDKLPASRLNAINPLLSQPAKEDTDPLAARLKTDGAKIAKPTQKKSEDDQIFRARKYLQGVAVKRALMEALPDLDQRAMEIWGAAQDKGVEMSPAEARAQAISDITANTRREVSTLTNDKEFRMLPVAEQARIMQQFAESLRQ